MRRYPILVAVLMMLGVLDLTAQQPFIITATPRTRTLSGASAHFSIAVSAQLGFSASVLLSAYSPTLPGATFVCNPSLVNSPYTTPVAMTVTLTGPKTGGTHTIVIEGRNGPAIARDSVTIVVEERPAWRVYTTFNSPLPGNRITAMAIDRNGAGWIGTNKGLARLDASGWTLFDADTIAPPPSDTNKPALMGNGSIGGIAVDSSNGVWVISSKRIVRYGGGRWTLLPPPPSMAFGGTADAIACDRKGNLWLAADGALLEFSGDRWISFPVSGGSNHLASVAIDSSGVLWLGDAHGFGVIRFDGTYWTYYMGQDIPMKMGEHRALAVDRQGSAWCVDRFGLVKFAGDGKTPYVAKAAEFPGPEPSSIDFDDDGTIWSGNGDGDYDYPSVLGDGGLVRYDGTTSWYYTIDNSGLPGNNITVVRASHDMSIWVGTRDNGLAILDGSAPPATLLLGVDDRAAAAAPSSMLRGIFPNPASTSATIALTIRKAGQYRIGIVDALGREATAPLRRRLEAGACSMELDLTGLAMGSYFVRIGGEGVSETRGLVIGR